MEEWRSISEFPDYKVSNIGNIVRIDGYKLKQHTTMFGYKRVSLKKHGKQYLRYMHRLVAEAFKPNDDKKAHVHHIDGNKQNNHVDNLLWVTNKEHGALKSKESKRRFRETYRRNKQLREKMTLKDTQ